MRSIYSFTFLKVRFFYLLFYYLFYSKNFFKAGFTADVSNKDLYDLKILEAIDYIKSVRKMKPTKERIQKYMARSNLKLQEEVLQMLLDNLEEEDI